MPYGNDPGTGTAAQRRDAVYFKLGLKDAQQELLGDAEVNFLLTNSGNAILPACIEGALAVSAEYSRQAKVGHGPSSVDPSQRADDYRELAKDLRRELANTATMDAGGISISDVQSTRDDTDRVRPAFTVDLDDFPGTDGNLNREELC